MGEHNRTRVLLADHFALVRAGVRCLLEEMDGFDIVAEADDGRDAIQLVARHRPDMVIMENGMPHLNGVDVTHQIVRRFPFLRVLILSGQIGEDHVLRALHAGASGYIHKGSLPIELRLAVESVARGEIYLSPVISRKVIEAYLSGAAAPAGSPQRLTSRQREILQLIAEGHSSKEIARIVKSSAKTVDNHRSNIMERLGLYNIADLVRYAVRHGLVSDQ